MPRRSIARYLTPWRIRGEQERQRFDQLRERDGDDCRRCRRPMRFDLAAGHDLAPRLEPLPGPGGGAGALDKLCLCHVRCNAEVRDATAEVQERLRARLEGGADERQAA